MRDCVAAGLTMQDPNLPRDPQAKLYCVTVKIDKDKIEEDKVEMVTEAEGNVSAQDIADGPLGTALGHGIGLPQLQRKRAFDEKADEKKPDAEEKKDKKQKKDGKVKKMEPDTPLEKAKAVAAHIMKMPGAWQCICRRAEWSRTA